jgi:hypothetical protein
MSPTVQPGPRPKIWKRIRRRSHRIQKWVLAPIRRRTAIERIEARLRPRESKVIALKDQLFFAESQEKGLKKEIHELLKTNTKGNNTERIKELIEKIKELIRLEHKLKFEIKKGEKAMEPMENALRRLERGWKAT